MKTFVAIFLTLFILMAFQISQASTAKPMKKEYVNITVDPDVGLIEGKGKTKSEAFKAAAENCFDKKLAANTKGESDDVYLDIIDQCANITY